MPKSRRSIGRSQSPVRVGDLDRRHRPASRFRVQFAIARRSEARSQNQPDSLGCDLNRDVPFIFPGGGFTYTYDNAGNLTGKTQVSNGNNWTYSWDYRNRLAGTVDHNSGGGVLMQGTYTYDGTNRRIGVDETVGGVETKTWTVYDGQNPYADFDGSGTLQQRYLYGPAVDQVLARTSSGGTSAWYLADKLGSVRDLANASGTVIDHVAYDFYGKIASETNPANGDRLKFAGREYDAATGLYFNRARYYDPATGRFIGQDPSGFGAGDTNLYRYVGNGPTNETDPIGLRAVGNRPTNPSNSPGVVSQDSPGYAQAMQAYQQNAHLIQDAGYEWSMMNPGNAAGPSFDPLNFASNLFNGYANTMTFGLTGQIQSQLGNDVYIDPTSPEYQAGGTIAQIQQQIMMQQAASLALCRLAAQSNQAAQAVAALRALMQVNAAANAAISAGESAQGAYEAYQRGDYWGMAWSAFNAVRSASSLAGLFETHCFAAGTPLLTPDGDKPIESFQVGDWVLAADQKIADGAIVARRVVRLFQNKSQVIILEVGCQAIRTTASHPFWAEGLGWTRADKLREGDRLRSHDDRWMVVAGVRDTGEMAAVYNLEVAEDHTYFVGAEAWGFSVWAHNSMSCNGDVPSDQSGASDSGGSVNQPTVATPETYSPTIPAIEPPTNRGGLRQAMGDPPEDMQQPQAHHDLPWNFRDWMAGEGRGLNVNDPENGRWIEGNPTGSHQTWSSAFNAEWQLWIQQNADAARQAVLDQMANMRSNPEYQ